MLTKGKSNAGYTYPLEIWLLVSYRFQSRRLLCGFANC